jgi:hypothetical protein
MVYLVYKFEYSGIFLYIFVGGAYFIVGFLEKKFTKRKPNTTYMTFSTDEEGRIAEEEDGEI